MSAIARRKLLTTGEVAKIASVSTRIVIRWIDSGKLSGYRIPGSMHRRVPREALIDFIQKSGMPMPAALAEEMAK